MKKKCPFCGGKNTVEIEYGDSNSELLEEYEAGNVYLCGHNESDDKPKRYCMDCKAHYAIDVPKSLLKEITKIEINVDSYNKFKLEKNRRGCFYTRENFVHYELQINEKRFERIIKHLLNRYYLLELKDSYVDKTSVNNHHQWFITISCGSEIIKKIYGSNDYPPMYKSMIRYISNIYQTEYLNYILKGGNIIDILK